MPLASLCGGAMEAKEMAAAAAVGEVQSPLAFCSVAAGRL